MGARDLWRFVKYLRIIFYSYCICCFNLDFVDRALKINPILYYKIMRFIKILIRFFFVSVRHGGRDQAVFRHDALSTRQGDAVWWRMLQRDRADCGDVEMVERATGQVNSEHRIEHGCSIFKRPFLTLFRLHHNQFRLCYVSLRSDRTNRVQMGNIPSTHIGWTNDLWIWRPALHPLDHAPFRRTIFNIKFTDNRYNTNNNVTSKDYFWYGVFLFYI